MSDRIRYALGRSAGGDFIAAMSDRGLVAFELCIGADTAVEDLVARFPGAIVEEDAAGLATTVATLSHAVSRAVSSTRNGSAEDPSLTLGIVASTNRLVRRNGSLAGGRACAASVAVAAGSIPHSQKVENRSHRPGKTPVQHVVVLGCAGSERLDRHGSTRMAADVSARPSASEILLSTSRHGRLSMN
jgi:hypothetical protein